MKFDCTKNREIGLAGPGIGVDVFWDGFVQVVMVQLAFNGTGRCPRHTPSRTKPGTDVAFSSTERSEWQWFMYNV